MWLLVSFRASGQRSFMPSVFGSTIISGGLGVYGEKAQGGPPCSALGARAVLARFHPPVSPEFFGALMRVNAHLSLVQSNDGAVFRCRCGELLAQAEENYKEYLAWAEMPCSAAGPYTTAALTDPGISTAPLAYALLEVDVVEKGEAISKEVELKLS